MHVTKRKQILGFTIVEILVVIAIIGLLAAIIYAALGKANADARNARRLSDISEYINAFEFYFDDTGEYPDPGDQNYYCLGKYTDNNCWEDGTISQNTTLNDILSNYYSTSAYVPGQYGDFIKFEGYVYKCELRPSDLCNKYSITWVMEGEEESCGKGTNPDNVNGLTFCQYVRP